MNPSTPKHGLMKSHRLIARTLAGVLFSTALAPAADDVSKFQQPGSVVTTATSQPGSKGLAPGKFGNAINLASDNGEVSIPIPGVLKDRPVTFACWVKLNSLTAYNIIMSVGPKSGKHWEVFTTPGGRLTNTGHPKLSKDAAIPFSGIRSDQRHFQRPSPKSKFLAITCAQEIIT